MKIDIYQKLGTNSYVAVRTKESLPAQLQATNQYGLQKVGIDLNRKLIGINAKDLIAQIRSQNFATFLVELRFREVEGVDAPR